MAECPLCCKESIFNRASDLHTFEPISGLDVVCQNLECGKPFRLVGDRVNSRHEMLIYDCYELADRKHYMSCVLNLAQAYEVFFGLYFRVELLYKPFGIDPDRELTDLNRITKSLHDRIMKHTFAPMRALFLQHILSRRLPKNLTEAEAIVATLPEKPGDPKDVAIENIDDLKLVTLLKSLKSTSIHILRNDVAHKQAYRPTRDQAETAIEETRSILLPLTSHLQLYDDINWYMRRLPA